MEIIPINDYLLLEQVIDNKQENEGFVLHEETTSNIVRQISEDIIEAKDLSIKVGDEVLIKQHSGIPIKHSDKTFLMVTYSEIIGYFNKGEK